MASKKKGLKHSRNVVKIKSIFMSFHIQSVNLLIHEADPQLRQVVIIVFAHIVRPFVRPHFSKQSKSNVCYWPSGSLMTPCLVIPLSWSEIFLANPAFSPGGWSKNIKQYHKSNLSLKSEKNYCSDTRCW